MKVLVDAQLPQKLARFFASSGIDAIHTLDLPTGNATSDKEIIQKADREERIVISKDSDFLDNFILESRPNKLFIVSTGNITNSELIRLFKQHIETIRGLFEEHNVVEIDNEEIQVHF